LDGIHYLLLADAPFVEIESRPADADFRDRHAGQRRQGTADCAYTVIAGHTLYAEGDAFQVPSVVCSSVLPGRLTAGCSPREAARDQRRSATRGTSIALRSGAALSARSENGAGITAVNIAASSAIIANSRSATRMVRPSPRGTFG